jgi:hypothetical protein
VVTRDWLLLDEMLVVSANIPNSIFVAMGMRNRYLKI